MKDMRGNFKRLLARCKFCKKTKVNQRTGNFTVVVHNPRRVLPEFTPCFSTVGMHLCGPFMVTPTGARSQWGRRGLRRIFALVVIDLLTGVYELDFLD